MSRFFHIIRKRKYARTLCAVAFLLLSICEIASHAFLDAHHHGDDHLPLAVVAETAHLDHDDHDCGPAAVCDEDGDHDRQSQNLQDQSSHHDVVFASTHYDFDRAVKRAERFVFSGAHGSFRAPTPPYSPPKRS